MKRTLTLVGLGLFLGGNLFLPQIHRLELAESEKKRCRHCACAGHIDSAHAARHAEGEQPVGHKHDPAKCAICRAAKAPFELPPLQIEMPFSEYACIPLSLTAELSVFTLPRLIPYSCGPPV